MENNKKQMIRIRDTESVDGDMLPSSLVIITEKEEYIELEICILD